MSRFARLRSTPRVFTGVALAVGLLTGGVAVAAGQALSRPDVPPTTPERLVASVLKAAATATPVSGMVAARLDLGIPTLSGQASQAASQPGIAGVLVSLSGDHRLRVWSSADGYRLSDLLDTSERSIFVSRTDAWAWDSAAYTAVHLGPYPMVPGAHAPPPGDLLDPMRLARFALRAADPSTAVSVGAPKRVAGRAAYVLVLTPRTASTLVGRVEVSIDAERRIPLGVEVFAKGAGSAAVSVKFASVSFAPIDASVYRFTAPPGARIVRPYREGAGEGDANGAHEPSEPDVASLFELGSPALTFGSGWASVVALRIPRPRLSGEAAGTLGELLPFSGTLLSVRLVSRGDHEWLVAGAVPQASLAKVEPELP